MSAILIRQIRLKGPKAWLNLNNNDADVEKGDYQMVGRQAAVMPTK